MFNLAQTIAVTVAALAAAYAVALSEVDRRRAERRARVERLLPAVLRLAAAAAEAENEPDAMAQVEMARRWLLAELAIARIEGFEGTELMTRPKLEMDGIVRQSEVAVREIAEAPGKVAPRLLLANLVRRKR